MKLLLFLAQIFLLTMLMTLAFYYGQRYERRVTEPNWKKALERTYWDGYSDAELEYTRRLYVREGHL